MIQRFFRGFKVRKNVSVNISIKIDSVIKIQKIARGMICRQKLRRELKEYMDEINKANLVKSLDQIRQEKAINIISRFYLRARNKRRRVRLENDSARLIQTKYRAKRDRLKSYISILQLEKYP